MDRRSARHLKWSSRRSQPVENRRKSQNNAIAAHVETAVALIDDLNQRIAALERELRRLGATHRYVPLLMTVPGIAWVLGYTIAAELGDIARFPTPQRLTGYTGLCPRVYQSGGRDRTFRSLV